jgi:tetratricopeptide (TPR) repeat protein
LEKHIRYLKWAEGLAAFWSGLFVSHYLNSPKLDVKVERELRSMAMPAFGTYLSILRHGKNLAGQLRVPHLNQFFRASVNPVSSERFFASLKGLRQKLELSGVSPEVGALDLLETLITLRNRSIGHGGIPGFDVFGAEEDVCVALETLCSQVGSPSMLWIQEARTSPDKPGEFVMYGRYFDGQREHPWTKSVNTEGLLAIRQLHFLDSDNHPVPSVPFLQYDVGVLWFLQKYRRGGNSLFTDFGSQWQKSDPYWDGYLRNFLEERFEKGGQITLQTSLAGVSHSLPTEDESYRRFIGRENELKLLEDRLGPSRQIPIIAIGGVGGVGKTSLARSLAQSIANSIESSRSFDYIVWVSAKTSTLKEFVEPLTPGFEDIDDVLDEVARVAESPELIYQRPFEKKKAVILDLLKSGRFLLVIDNFETVKRKDSFWEFLLEIPAPSKALVTSREKYSEGCLTLDLKELTEPEAFEMFSVECRGLGMDPAVVLRNQKDRLALHQSTGGIPLALKHVAILVHRGKPLKEALQGLDGNKGPIADFCFRGTFNALGKQEKNTWVAMGIFQQPVTLAEIVQVTEMGHAEASDAIQTLSKYSIVNREVHVDGYEFFWCLPLTLEFAKKQVETWPEAAEMGHRYRQFRSLLTKAGIREERSQATRALKEISVLHPRLVARELARNALSKYRLGQVEEAYELLESAERIDAKEPIVWETKVEVELGEFQYEPALQASQNLLDLLPNNLAALRQATTIAKRLEDWVAAVQYGRRVTNLPGATRRDWHILGHMYYKKAQAHHLRGERAKEEETLLESLDCFKRALIGQPTTFSDKRHNATVYDTMARAYNYLHRTDEAVESVVSGLLLDPYNTKLLELQLQLTGRAI